MHFMSRYWIKKLVRDIKKEKFLFTALVILSLSGVGSYLALTLGYSNLESSYELIYKKTNFADVEISTHKEVWFNLSEVKQDLAAFQKNRSEIKTINYRLILDSGYNITSDPLETINRRYIAGGRIIGINTTLPKSERVNDLIVEDGEYLSSNNNPNDVLLESIVQNTWLSFLLDSIFFQLVPLVFYTCLWKLYRTLLISKIKPII
ncbi:MAG: hypothetical protein ACTSR2_04685 [Candidatus Hodarchaeales archaeon]